MAKKVSKVKPESSKAPPKKTPKKNGRPSKYTDKLADKICQMIAQGQSVRSICAKKDMISMQTFFRWLRENDKFREQYAHAGGGRPYCQGRLSEWICLLRSTPTLFNGDFRRPAAVSLLRLRVAEWASHGMFTVYAIAFAVRLGLRTRLTPG